MSFFDKILSKDNNDEPQKNIGKITTDKATEIIKTLSGGEAHYTKKVIDNVIVFSNPSGGTGTSTILANVGYTAAIKGFRVLVIDLNVLYPTQHLYFGNNKGELEKPDLVGFLLGKNSVGEAIENNGKVSLMYAHNRGLMDSINAESDIAINNFSSALHRLRQLFDLVLIDCPMQIDHTLYNMAFYSADSIYMVWDEGISSIANTERVRRNMASSGIDAYTKMKIILNKRTNIQYNKYPFQKLNVELVEILPFTSDIIWSSLRSEIFCEKGSSKDKNADIFYNGIESLTDKMLEIGGYVK